MCSLRIPLLLSLCVACASKASDPANESPALPALYRNTWYYFVTEEEFPNAPKDTEVLDLEGNSLARVHAKFKKALDIQGSGRLVDGRVLNFAGRANDPSGPGVRYKFVDAPYGLGVGACPLVPYRSLAVDPRRIPLGSLVRIEETVGMRLPDGSLHDGVWRAEDIGSAIQGDRIDLFAGAGYSSGKVILDQGIRTLQPLHVSLLKAPSEGEESCIRRSMW